MPDSKTTEAQVVYERIEELKAQGVSNADAIRQVAEERGKSENAVRANQHQYRQKAGSSGASGGRSRRSARSDKRATPTVEDVVAQARELLQGAVVAIESEVDAAKAELDAAQTRYDKLVASITERKAELEKKIKALS